MMMENSRKLLVSSLLHNLIVSSSSLLPEKLHSLNCTLILTSCLPGKKLLSITYYNRLPSYSSLTEQLRDILNLTYVDKIYVTSVIEQ